MGNCRIESGQTAVVLYVLEDRALNIPSHTETGLREPLPITVERSRAGLDRLVGHVVHYGSTVDIITIITRP